MAHLEVTLGLVADGLRVNWRLEGAELSAGTRLGHLAMSIAGAPTSKLDGNGLTATDEIGSITLAESLVDGPDGDLRVWTVERSTAGTVDVSYVARPVNAPQRPAVPPIDLRREGDGLSGACACFLVLPPATENISFNLRWEPSVALDTDQRWASVCSLGEDAGRDGGLAGAGLELLSDTYVVCGDLAAGHYRDGDMSTWWLTPPAFDVEAFTAHLGWTYRLMAEQFEAPARPYRVFLRASPHQGSAASAHPASFVMTVNPEGPVNERLLYSTVAHELVHEWLHLDGQAEEVTWFNEGAADYYSLVIPFREGLIDQSTFLGEVNLAARIGYASPLRELTLDEASRRYDEDFRARRLAYVRGMFYLADLDARLRNASPDGLGSVTEVVKRVLRSQRAGEHVGVEEWCALVADLVGADERPALESFVFVGDGRPGTESFGPTFTAAEIAVPVLDVGFDASTFVTRRATGVVAGGAADRAGVREGNVLQLPGYSEAVGLNVGDSLKVEISRDGEKIPVSIPLRGRTAPVPQWR
ncbi:hypothetical protein [Kineosporia sp. A_224]|uniref:hypothetical protein n=1 Tax=Kineosporia sp. A_224 TaxID=1962180 RepID=UPI000B4A850B|nr:hypothetical protein [Kineosporia sp. A_224]